MLEERLKGAIGFKNGEYKVIDLRDEITMIAQNVKGISIGNMKIESAEKVFLKARLSSNSFRDREIADI